jgi:hypothetical protein
MGMAEQVVGQKATEVACPSKYENGSRRYCGRLNKPM